MSFWDPVVGVYMGEVTQAFPNWDLEKFKQKVKAACKHRERQKWLVIYKAIVDPRPTNDVMHLGGAKGFVHKVIQQYNRLGKAAFATLGKGWRQNYDLSWLEEKKLIDSFKQKARKGHVACASEIQQVYEQIGDFRVHKTTIYRLLERH